MVVYFITPSLFFVVLYYCSFCNCIFSSRLLTLIFINVRTDASELCLWPCDRRDWKTSTVIFKHFCIEQTGDSIIIFCKHLTALVFSSCKQPLPSPITLLDHRVCTVQPLLITPVGDVPGWGLFSTVWLDCSDFESNLFKQTYIIWHTSGSKFRYLHILYDLETLLIIHFLFCRLRHTRF